MKITLAILLLFTCATSLAQVNLVMNPSLEQYSICPNTIDEIKYADSWMSLDSSWSPPAWASDSPGVPEYCNACAPGYTYCTVPSATLYYHYPRTGNGMSEVQMFYNNYYAISYGQQRDYLQGHLFAPLTAGQSIVLHFM